MKKQPTFLEGTGLALIFSIIGAAGFFTLGSLFGSGDVFRLLITCLGFSYVVYLLSRSRERVGKITVITGWLLLAVLNWLFVPSFLLYIIIHLGMIWLVRSLYFYNSVLSSLLDLGLSGISLAVAVWTWSISHSLFLSFWCFFLVQALFIHIPRQTGKTDNRLSAGADSDDPFERAHHAAELAVRKLTITHS